jgi:hypothetical protein
MAAVKILQLTNHFYNHCQWFNKNAKVITEKLIDYRVFKMSHFSFVSLVPFEASAALLL